LIVEEVDDSDSAVVEGISKIFDFSSSSFTVTGADDFYIKCDVGKNTNI
jgi:hypothetical protein